MELRGGWSLVCFGALGSPACIELGELREEPEDSSPSVQPDDAVKPDSAVERDSGGVRRDAATHEADASHDLEASTMEVPRVTTDFAQSGAGHKQIDANGFHTCVVDDERVLCWGNNAYGQLGDGSEIPSKPSLPTEVTNLSGVVDVSVGLYHSCALVKDGSVWCWGDDATGQLGDGAPYKPSSVPVRVLGIERAVDLDAGDHFGCAVIDDGRVRCWGHDAEGQLGESVLPEDTQRPAGDVEGIRDATVVSAGGKHACAILGSGALRCWGENVWGQLGDGREDEATRSVPEDVAQLREVSAVVTGAHNTCAILPDRTLWCWGFDEWGTLGDGDPNRNSISYLPRRVNGLDAVLEVSVGSLHVCALDEDGSVQCWGPDHYGQIGDATNTDLVKESPTDVEVPFIASQLATGSWHSCARSNSGSVSCWGSNEHGQVGIGSVVPEVVALPVPVVGL